MRETETEEESAPGGCGEVKLEFPGKQLTGRQTEALLVGYGRFPSLHRSSQVRHRTTRNRPKG